MQLDIKLTTIFFILISCTLMSTEFKIKSAKIENSTTIKISYTGSISQKNMTNWKIEPNIPISRTQIFKNILKLITTKPFYLNKHYFLKISEKDKIFLIPDGILDSLYSDKLLGYQLLEDKISFRVFAPRAHWVRLVLFDKFSDDEGREYPMEHDSNGVWEYFSHEDWRNKYYGYRLWGPQGEGEMFDSTVVVADPYSPAVVTKNHFHHIGKTLIIENDDFTWQEDTWQKIDWLDLIIYEMHLRDLTAHPSSGLNNVERGSYLSLIIPDQKGGLTYIKNLGVNAVELLPAQDFGNIEVPFMDEKSPVFNTWNPYERNHWGYMTSYFFAPESYYASGGNLVEGQYNGIHGNQVIEFKKMIKSFHDNGIAVLMDVVYNHVSQYDYNPLKYIDKFYYFHLNEDCSFTSVSGCGNDLKTDRPMVRRLITDSVIQWMKEYHIDGFRFDLAKMIDWETCDMIRDKAQDINPHVILIAEPWGGGYDPSGFSDHGWASWNDQIRNGVKGQNPNDGLGFIFGKWQGDNTLRSLRRYILGSLRDYGGQYIHASHAVNYFESHDDHTLGDFIRIGLKDITEDDIISDFDEHAKLTPKQLSLNKLSALFLFTVQGPIMIHEGQEFARSKVIAPTTAPDPKVGKIDHNSYNKDNETNWLNFKYAESNSELVEYYKGLIRLRKEHPAFRCAIPNQFYFYDQPDSLFITYKIDYHGKQYVVLLNGNPEIDNIFNLLNDSWKVLVDNNQASWKPLRSIQTSKIKVPASSGMIIYRSSF